MSLIKLEAFGNIYSDAHVATESGELLFISLIGSQTEIRRLQAAVTIGDGHPESGGLSVLRGFDEANKLNFTLRISNSGHLGQHSGVMSKTLFGDLVHLWVYNEQLLRNPDYSNGIGYFLIETGEGSTVDDQIWQLFNILAEIPLLKEWKTLVLSQGKRFYKVLSVIDPEVPCVGVKLDLSSGFTDFIEALLKSGELVCEAA